MADRISERVDKSVAKLGEIDIIELTRKYIAYERFPALQERIEELIEHDLISTRNIIIQMMMIDIGCISKNIISYLRGCFCV